MVSWASLESLFDDLLDAMLPARCPGCERRAGSVVCESCAATLAPAPFAPPPPPVEWWVARFAYEGVARELVARAKYRNERRFLTLVARELAAAVASAPSLIDLVTWAPASAARVRAQGVDHGELLARAVARRAGAKVAPTLRRGPGQPQTGLDASARRRGPQLHALARVGGTILVVDDVATTGGTLAAAARALRAGGAASVFAATIARTPPPRGGVQRAAYTPTTPAGIRAPRSIGSRWTSSSSASM